MANLTNNIVKSYPNTKVFTPRLDKLAQRNQKNATTPGSSVDNTLSKRASSKYYTNELVIKLCNLKSPLMWSYYRTLKCCDILEIDDTGKVKSKYCKARWCITCSRIRSAVLINKYKPILSGKVLATLTLTTDYTKTCRTIEELKRSYACISKSFSNLMRKVKRKFGNTIAISKFEVTWQDYRGTFHPHLHVILENKYGQAEYIKSEWLKIYSNALEKSQHVGYYHENTLIETFKYITKMWKKSEDKNKPILPFSADKLDIIFQCVKDKRVIKTYGIKVDKEVEDLEDFEVEIATIKTDNIAYFNTSWSWWQKHRTWVSDDGELLTNFKYYTENELFSP